MLVTSFEGLHHILQIEILETSWNNPILVTVRLCQQWNGSNYLPSYHRNGQHKVIIHLQTSPLRKPPFCPAFGWLGWLFVTEHLPCKNPMDSNLIFPVPPRLNKKQHQVWWSLTARHSLKKMMVGRHDIPWIPFGMLTFRWVHPGRQTWNIYPMSIFRGCTHILNKHPNCENGSPKIVRSSYLSNEAIFHFRDYRRKSMRVLKQTSPLFSGFNFYRSQLSKLPNHWGQTILIFTFGQPWFQPQDWLK